MNVREVSSAPNQNDEHHGQATTAVNSVSASVDSKCKQGDQFQRKACYNGTQHGEAESHVAEEPQTAEADRTQQYHKTEPIPDNYLSAKLFMYVC